MGRHLYAQANGACTAAGMWKDTGGTEYTPGDGDSCHLNGKTVTGAARFPASGTLTLLDAKDSAAAQTNGTLTYALNTLGSCSLFALSVGGGPNACVTATGAAPAATLTINGNVQGGAATSNYGVYTSSTGTIAITGDVTGGAGSYAHGVVASGNGTITVGGNVTGGPGSGIQSMGISNDALGAVTIAGNLNAGATDRCYGLSNASSGVCTVGGTITHGTATSAHAGAIRWNPAAANYAQYPKTSGTAKYPTQLAAADVRSGTVHGDRTGTMIPIFVED